MKGNRFRLDCLLLFLLYLLTFFSSQWIVDHQSKPPLVQTIIAWASFFMGIALVARFVQMFYKQSPLSTDAVPRTGPFALQELLDNNAELNGHFEELVIAIKDNKLSFDSPLFDSHIRELRAELGVWVRLFFITKVKSFMITFIRSIIFIILIFATFYILDFTIEATLHNPPLYGFHYTLMPKGDFIRWIVEAVYFTLTTVSTLGFGDIRPHQCILARSIIIFELLTFMLVFSLGVSFSFVLLESLYIFDSDDIANSFVKKLKTHARYAP
jgi:hypothetical protein